MTSKPQSRSIRSLARLYGIHTSYVNVEGRRRQAPLDSLRQVLTSLGARAGSPDEIAASLASKRRLACDQAASPTIVAWNGSLQRLELRGPRDCRDPWRVELQLEGGASLDLSPACRPSSRPSNDANCVVRVLHHRQRLPSGYHTLRVERNGTSTTSTVIAAPRRAYGAQTGSAPSEWGVVAPVYALRSSRNWGSGDLSDLEDVWRWLEPHGGRLLGTLPLMAVHLQAPFDFSPYAPLSRRVWNEMYLAIDKLPEMAECAAARELVGSASFQEEIRQLRTDALIDYPRQCLLRRPVLELLARHLFEQRGPRWLALQQATREEPLLEDYARFRAVGERHGKPWPEWPERQRAGIIESGDYDPAAFQYHLYAQWATRVQIAALGDKLRGQGATLYLDYPVGVHRHGYDAWRFAELFVPSISVGAPPDAVFTKGQDWGLAPLHPGQLQATGYRYFLDSIRCQLQHAGALRVDHVMGLHRQFWIPAGRPAAEGVYMSYPAEELYAVLCLESHRNRARVIGENLGTVPPAVNQALERHGIGGTYVVQYELQPRLEEPLAAPEKLSMASINTHDMPTFAAYWQGLDLDDLFKLGLFDVQGIAAERERREKTVGALLQFLRQAGLLADEGRGPSMPDVRNSLLLWLAGTNAGSLLINLEDLWLEVLPQNVPGTSLEFPNWRRKLRHALVGNPPWRGADDILSRVRQARMKVPPDVSAAAIDADQAPALAPSEATR